MTATPQPLPELVSFLETLPEPHILCDRSYRILAANAAYRANCGPGADLIGRKCFEVSHRYPVPCDQAGESCPLARSLVSGQRERVVHLHHTSTGESYENIELSPIRGSDGEIAWFIEKLEPLPGARGLAGTQGLLGRAPAFRHMLELVARVAPSDATVLLQGESGTGKELVAQAIHEASRRSARPFVAVDCSGLTETLFESELFGHERGAFTGASARKIGLVGLWDVVAFDEVAGINFKDHDGVQIMKDYMASGSFSRGRDSIEAKASMVFVGNINQSVETLVKTSHLLAPFPEAMIDTAFFDRFHAYIPGWEIPKMRPEFFTNSYGLITDYLAEYMREMRKRSFADALDRFFKLGNNLNQRDVIAVRRTVSGLLKLLHPDGRFSKDDVRSCLTYALETRRRIKEQLKKLGGGN